MLGKVQRPTLLQAQLLFMNAPKVA
ncbi:MAG: hypothetical protein JWO94_619, partial [Verrucomicrobiaceae bacterium]|nr:hypothetical protein [Verrucomicrobiaceae bacterium]